MSSGSAGGGEQHGGLRGRSAERFSELLGPVSRLSQLDAFLLIWVPLLLVSMFHYGTGPEVRWLHDLLRRVYYLPILVGAFVAGLRGGLFVSSVVVLVYLPHAFTHLGHLDPGRGTEKFLEIVLYFVVGGVAGWLSDRAETRRRQAEETARKLEQALREQRHATEQLVRAGKAAALGEMVAGVAHELRNPLHTLQGTVEILDPIIPRDREEAHMWGLLKGEVSRMGGISEKFLTFAAPGPAEYTPLDLRYVARRCRELIQVQARKVGVEMEFEEQGAGDEAALVVGDADRLLQVAVNIGLNALQAMEGGNGGRLVLRVEEAERTSKVGSSRGVGPHGGESGSVWVMSFENDGPVVAEDDLPRLFDPFFSRRSGGSGLGLAIAARIVEQHHGFIRARNIGATTGVRFEVGLPRAD